MKFGGQWTGQWEYEWKRRVKLALFNSYNAREFKKPILCNWDRDDIRKVAQGEKGTERISESWLRQKSQDFTLSRWAPSGATPDAMHNSILERTFLYIY